ncbi:hypothetical protein DRN50_01790 [Thermococci archaeon]|nr:MAG: hypothetical protein DRN50_01790 [Thermococci archaeon]
MTRLQEKKMLLDKYFRVNEKTEYLLRKRLHLDFNLDNIKHVTDEELSDLFEDLKKYNIPKDNFYGQYYTVTDGNFSLRPSWDEMKERILECVYSEEGEKVYKVLRLLERKTDYALIKTKVFNCRKALDMLLGRDIIKKEFSQGRTVYYLRDEIKFLVKNILYRVNLTEETKIKSKLAKEELMEMRRMDLEFENYLSEISDYERVDLDFLLDYLKKSFGELYFDIFLSIIQQYSLSDVNIINSSNETVMKTGFNLAFFGDPGTGKTFAIDTIIRGDETKNIPPHGIPGRNRYCGGMTAARFIRIGEAYQNRKFNFIIPEFNDWFKYRGMVEPMKLAMEQKEIKYEIKDEVVGPYKFESFFTVNYNTKISGKNYKITIQDPNFNAIEDRMLCRLHRLTQDRYKAIAESQKNVALGKIDLRKSREIRDHLTYVYACGQGYGGFYKPVLLEERVYETMEDLRDKILDEVDDIRFSPRLESRSIQLACSISLLNYLKYDSFVEIDKKALNLALRFFLEEIWMRSRESFDLNRFSEYMK